MSKEKKNDLIYQYRLVEDEHLEFLTVQSECERNIIPSWK